MLNSLIPTDLGSLLKAFLTLASSLDKVTYLDMLYALPWTLLAMLTTYRLFAWEMQGVQQIKQLDRTTGKMYNTYRLNSLGDLAVLWVLVAWMGKSNQAMAIVLSPLLYGSVRKLYLRYAEIRQKIGPNDS